jgi:hypothetical protein
MITFLLTLINLVLVTTFLPILQLQDLILLLLILIVSLLPTSHLNKLPCHIHPINSLLFLFPVTLTILLPVINPNPLIPTRQRPPHPPAPPIIPNHPITPLPIHSRRIIIKFPLAHLLIRTLLLRLPRELHNIQMRVVLGIPQYPQGLFLAFEVPHGAGETFVLNGEVVR